MFIIQYYENNDFTFVKTSIECALSYWNKITVTITPITGLPNLYWVCKVYWFMILLMLSSPTLKTARDMGI